MLYQKLFNPEHIENLSKDDPRYSAGKAFEVKFTTMVEGMMDPSQLPLPAINSLMRLFWRLVGNKIVPSAMGGVPTLSFFAEIRSHKSAGMVICPEDWLDKVQEDPYYQMGALVFAASQAKDYWNHKFVPGSRNEIHARAWSYEAEWLHFLAATDPAGFKPNAYQQKIMNEYPQGIASEPSNYEGREYDGVFPPYPVDVGRVPSIFD